MSGFEKHPILANGEYYITPLEKRIGGGNITRPHEYFEAKQRLLSNIDSIQAEIEKEKEIFVKEKVVCVRLEPKYEAKSYVPTSLISESHMKLIGGRKYSADDTEQSKAKMYFLRATNAELEDLKTKFSTSEKDGVKSWREQICTIKSIDFLSPSEKTMGFPDDWEEGVVEIVLHPLGSDYKEAIKGFFRLTNLNHKNVAVRSYDDGLTFLCARMNKTSIESVQKYNPLRSIKPLDDDWDELFLRRSSIVAPAPQPPEQIIKPFVKIGVFDGGVKSGTPLLDPYVVSHDMVGTKATERFLDHGSGVCGAVLYGTNLRGKTESDHVDNPSVSIESFRVFPTVPDSEPTKNYQMYSTIDIIERVVSERSDIKIYNVSFGPKGAILDDDINRFTYVCDKLSYDAPDGINPLFCIAAGNDGNLEKPLNRIQSPADMVNGLGIGAYSISFLGDKYRSSYSCIGPGREGAKIKPDLLEFGGDTSMPFITTKSGAELMGEQGTSFASPVVAGKIGKLMAASPQIHPHMARALLIHHATPDESISQDEQGFGLCPNDVTEVLNCSDKKVTILYEGEISSTTTAKLPIFLPDVSTTHGMAHLTWTICTVVNPNVNDSDAYTNNCIEDTFYPNEMKFNFRGPKKTEQLNLLKSEDIQRAKELFGLGYQKSELPVSRSAKPCFAEADLRSNDYKWDTVIRKEISMRCSSLLSPFLSLHAIGRDDYEREKIKYFVVITVDIPKYSGSVYDGVLQTYRNLAPIEIQNINRISAQT